MKFDFNTFIQIADVLGIFGISTIAFFAFKAIPSYALDKPYSLFSRFCKWTAANGFGVQTFLFVTGGLMLALVVIQLVWTAIAAFIAGIILAMRLRRHYGSTGNARWASC